jgi:nucleotide-binding universal stress UspA family protein
VFSKIVIGFDESEGSKDALAYAGQLAERFDSEVIVVTAIPSPIGGSFAPALPADAFTRLQEQAVSAAEQAAAEIGGRAEVVESLSPARGVEQLAEDIGADLIVIGCSKAEPGRVRAGRQARHMMHGASCAVLMAPVGHADSGTYPERIGVAVNGSAESAHAVMTAAVLAEGGTLSVISVATDFAEYWGHWGATFALSDLAEAARDVARTDVEEAMAMLPVTATSEGIVLEGSAAIELKGKSRDLDLLCLGSRRFGPVRRVLLGSVTSELVGDVGCAVLVSPRTDS